MYSIVVKCFSCCSKPSLISALKQGKESVGVEQKKKPLQVVREASGRAFPDAVCP